ncbi:MAG: hypothetical protein U9O86_04700 [Campylobacterota bacterium]|nr:hypothetical protein [Campylobacterota bacterium]
MSEQSKILTDMQDLIMAILKTGTASVEQGNQLDRLEDQLHKQKCFKVGNSVNGANKGEEIATLFFNNKYEPAIDKMFEYKITPEDFFGFAEYHFDEEEGEELIEMFTASFREKVTDSINLKKNS